VLKAGIVVRAGATLAAVVAGLAGFNATVSAHDEHAGPHPVRSPSLAAAPGSFDPAAYPPLRLLAREAAQVVEAQVESIKAFDDGRLRVMTVRVAGVLKGAARNRLRIVDQSAAVRSRSLIDADRPVVLLLNPAGDYSYLRQHLARGDYREVWQDHGGVWQAEHAGNHPELVGHVRRVLQAGDDPAALRHAAFQALASPEQRIRQDGMRELVRLAAPAALTPAETTIVRERLADGGPVPEALTDWLAAARPANALPLLVEAATGLRRMAGNESLLFRLYAARAAYGAPATPGELEPDLGHALAGVRAAAAAALSFQRTQAAVARLLDLGRTDASTEVRVAVIEALGRIGSDDAIAALAGLFDTDHTGLRQSSGAVLRELGAAAALERLARQAATPVARQDAAAQLSKLLGGEHPRIRALLRNGPPDVRESLATAFEQPRSPHAH
jgi:HEAT repeat protein